ncbi:MAG: hypothetical protein ACYC0H_11105 [Solirubrobacteraceae bacterium]
MGAALIASRPVAVLQVPCATYFRGPQPLQLTQCGSMPTLRDSVLLAPDASVTWRPTLNTPD